MRPKEAKQVRKLLGSVIHDSPGSRDHACMHH
eukprot:SAG11_NODE_7422_length_1147_cov_0.814885_1_plen_31_part_10